MRREAEMRQLGRVDHHPQQAAAAAAAAAIHQVDYEAWNGAHGVEDLLLAQVAAVVVITPPAARINHIQKP